MSDAFLYYLAKYFLDRFSSDKRVRPLNKDLYRVGRGVCKIQLDYPQVEIMVRNRISEIEKAIQDFDQAKNEEYRNNKREEIKQQERDLKRFIVRRTRDTCNVAIKKYLLEFFVSYKKSDIPPRLTLKVPVGNNTVADFWRERGGEISDDHVPTNVKDDRNSAFSDIIGYGGYALYNDIPCFIQKGDYCNERIDSGAVKKFYKRPNFFSRIWHKIYAQPESDEKWDECWHDGVEGDNRSTYKSTLVIPATLLGAESVDQEVAGTLGIEYNSNTQNEQNRKWIFGFLCIDHPHYDYFNNYKDVVAGYIFADLLCLYLILLAVVDKHPSVKRAQEI